jgi:hypothetical protein
VPIALHKQQLIVREPKNAPSCLPFIRPNGRFFSAMIVVRIDNQVDKSHTRKVRETNMIRVGLARHPNICPSDNRSRTYANIDFPCVEKFSNNLVKPTLANSFHEVEGVATLDVNDVGF